LILADEPTGNLDDESADAVTRLLLDLSNGRRTLLVATHDDRIVAAATHVLTLDGGRLTGDVERP